MFYSTSFNPQNCKGEGGIVTDGETEAHVPTACSCHHLGSSYSACSKSVTNTHTSLLPLGGSEHYGLNSHSQGSLLKEDFPTPVVAGEDVREPQLMTILGVWVPNDPFLINLACKFLS